MLTETHVCTLMQVISVSSFSINAELENHFHLQVTNHM